VDHGVRNAAPPDAHHDGAIEDTGFGGLAQRRALSARPVGTRPVARDKRRDRLDRGAALSVFET